MNVESERILILPEIGADVSEQLKRSLTAEGYDVTVAGNADEGKRLLSARRPFLILLDVVIPGSKEAGWDLLQEIREHGTNHAVIVVTELSRVDDRVRALNLGADDVISTPFHVEEVKARIRAVLRRARSFPARPTIAIDDVRKEVRVRERCVTLSPKEYGLLKLLASSPGRVFSCSDILATLWPARPYANRQDVQKYVYLLRKKVEDNPKDPRLILTVRGFGYRLSA